LGYACAHDSLPLADAPVDPAASAFMQLSFWRVSHVASSPYPPCKNSGVHACIFVQIAWALSAHAVSTLTPEHATSTAATPAARPTPIPTSDRSLMRALYHRATLGRDA
jgi:hypothetical protein